MKTKCKNCAQEIPLKKELLKKYEGKIFTFLCPKCKEKVQVRVQASNNEETIIGVKDNNFSSATKIGQIKTLLDDNTTEQTFLLESGKKTIGRLSNVVNAPKADFPIKTLDTYMSKLHCIIEVEKQANGKKGFILKNYSTVTNKIIYKGNRMEGFEEIYLKNGDSFKIGRTTLIFHVIDKPS